MHVYDNATGEPIGTIDEADLALLTDALEEESSSDQDYYIDRDTVDFIAGRGGSEGLLAVLSKALAGRDEAEIRWSRE